MSIIISGFPGTGKSTLVKSRIDVIDLDLPKRDWVNGVETYIEAIREQVIQEIPIILVTSHEELRKALKDNNIPYCVVLPSKECKQEYIQRYIDRGSPSSLIEVIEENYDSWLYEINFNEDFIFELEKGEYLMDVIDSIIKSNKDV